MDLYSCPDISYNSPGLFKNLPHTISWVRRLLHRDSLCVLYAGHYSE